MKDNSYEWRPAKKARKHPHRKGNVAIVVVAGVMVLAVLYLFEPGPVLSFVKHVWP